MLKKIMASVISIFLLVLNLSVTVSAQDNTTNKDEVVMHHPTYGIGFTNLRAGGTSTDYSYVAGSGTVVGGGSNTFTVGYSKATTISTGVEVSKVELFNITFGFSESETVWVEQNYSYYCPAKYTSCSVRYYPQYTNYSYDETLFGEYNTSGTAKVLTGFTQTVTYN